MQRIISLLILTVIVACPAYAVSGKEGEKIDYLLSELENSPLKFIRNGDEHSGKEAAGHLRAKLQYAGDRVKTVEDFITLVATKSSYSGEPYFVKLGNGQKIPARDWMFKKLKDRKD